MDRFSVSPDNFISEFKTNNDIAHIPKSHDSLNFNANLGKPPFLRSND